MLHSQYSVQRFNNDEIQIQLPFQNFHDHILLFKKFFTDIHEEIFEILLVIIKCYEAGAKSVSLLLPYMPYSRNENLIYLYKLLSKVGVQTITTVEIHQSVSFISSLNITSKIIHFCDFKDSIIVSPDLGGKNRVKQLAHITKNQWLCMYKKRFENDIHHQEIQNKCIRNKNVLLIDDIIDSGKTILSATQILLNSGAKSVNVLAIHGVFSRNAIELLSESPIKKIYVTNSIIQPELPSKFHIINIDELIIQMTINKQSLILSKVI